MPNTLKAFSHEDDGIFFHKKKTELLTDLSDFFANHRCVHSDDTVLSGNLGLKDTLIKQLNEFKVDGSIREQLKRNESISIERLDDIILDANKGSSLMQTLAFIPGINFMSIGTGSSKPIIRGMGYYRVLVARNGIKSEGQQWSNHHGIPIEQQTVRYVDFIKGPASLQYGSDAIGGVIDLITSYIPKRNGLRGEVTMEAKSNTNWLGCSANFSYRKGAVYGTFMVNQNSFTDFKIPATESFLLPAPVSLSEASHKVKLGDRMLNTAGSNSAISLLAGITKGWGNSYVELSYYATKSGFFDWQGLQNDSLRSLHALDSRDVNLPWQKIQNYSLSYFLNRYYNNNKLEIALGVQSNISSEHAPLNDLTGSRPEALISFRKRDDLELWLKLQTFTYNTSYTIKSIDKQSVKFGINSHWQTHKTDGYNHILPEYTRVSAGLFAIHQFELSPGWILNSGARFDYHFFQMDETLNPDPILGDSLFNSDFKRNFSLGSYSFGVNYLPDNETVLKINIGKSYRVPSAYELGAFGLHRHEGRFEKGDTTNNPENAWQLDMGFERKWQTGRLSVSPFITYFKNYINLIPSPILRREGQVFGYHQTRAMLMGGEVSFSQNLSKVLVDVGVEYVYAVNLGLKSALPFTPPFNVLTQISYPLKDARLFRNTTAGMGILWVASQNYTVPNELSTPGYETVNINLASDIQVGKHVVKAMVQIKNLFNASYFNHVSFYRRLRIPEPGRDIQLFLSIPL